MRISYSALETFLSCPAKYKYQYIEKIKTPKNKEAVFGTLVHDSLKFFHEPGRLMPVAEDELLKYFTNKWNSEVYQDKQEEAFAFHQGISILKNYHLANYNQEFNIVGLESPFSVNISAQNETHQITGRIDRIDKIDNGFEIVDYKTAKKMPSQETVDDNFQLSIYYLGIVNRWPMIEQEKRPIKLSLYYLRHGEKLSSQRTNDQINQSQEKILSIIDQINQSNFEPKINPLCDWCPYQKYCPLFKHKFINQDSPTPDENKIKEIISEYFEIKSRQGQDNQKIAQLKQAINDYCDANNLDRVFGDEGQITRMSQQRFSYDFGQVKQILEPLGKWESVLAINNTKFKKVINALPHPVQQQIEKTKKLEKEFKVISISRKT